jgi:hypothetical protein
MNKRRTHAGNVTTRQLERVVCATINIRSSDPKGLVSSFKTLDLMALFF